ncbi:transmembrane protein adipocyte-associated 1 homolog [Bacillus rossius redtenbacheri]|uniref:transmembrane protein adipocyte-associated 1 homolog n=1 Tax=Bacillus rossius redtenbacheri TaxID=93214 RepID=UPI002FDD1984
MGEGVAQPGTDAPVPRTTQPAQPIQEEAFCKLILYMEIADTRIRIWDVIILVPNFLFLLFLAVRFNRARLKLRATSSPVFLAFYGLVVVSVVISVVRCAVSMSVNASAVVGGYADKVLWITVRFFLLAMEISVVVFGLACGHLDSRSSIRHVLLATSLISLAFSITQGYLEVFSPDTSFHIDSKGYDLFGHGGMLFWFVSSVAFALVYSVIFVLPWTALRDRLALPTKRSFYAYILFLILLDATQSAGSGLLYFGLGAGLCVVDVTTCVYFTLLTPLVYHTFLSEFFGVSQPSILFSYKAQVDDNMEDDTVSLPHQQSFSSLKTDSDYIYQNNSVYDSTQFDTGATPVNPLYAASLQSPDSITGYSIDSAQSVETATATGYQKPQ